MLAHYRTIFQILLLKQTQNGLQSRFTVKRFCKSFFPIKSECYDFLSGSVADLYEKNGRPVYYRSSGGRYYNIITNFPTGSTKEKSIIVKSQYRDFVSAILSSNLYYWFYHIYSNNLDLKSYELNMFPIPIENFSKESVVNIEKNYDEYLKDLHKNSKVKQVRYAHVSEYREYYARYSKHLIDKIDLEIREPYGFTDEEIHFIINYDIEFRTSNEE